MRKEIGVMATESLDTRLSNRPALFASALRFRWCSEGDSLRAFPIQAGVGARQQKQPALPQSEA